MIERVLEPRLRHLATQFPIVTVTGPRQAGKTTLCRMVFPQHPYVSLEAPDLQAFARTDPRGFLAQYPDGAILDEVHRVPDLLSYLQPLVDAERRPGRFILTGSANFALLQSIGQSLAGRTALLELLPLSLDEVRRFPRFPDDLFDQLWTGCAPAIYDRDLQPGDWYPSYVATYVERDVRAIVNVGDLSAFQTMLRLCAGRVGQLLNLSSLGSDSGIVHGTVRAWLSVLEAGYIVWRLPPLHGNLGKRLIKTPKLHFFDSGMVCWLLGIRSAEQLRAHPLRGAIFESWVASEVFKARVHRGLPPSLSFYRDTKGVEVDLIVELANEWLAIESKSSQTIAADFFSALDTLARTAAAAPTPRAVTGLVVYGGEQTQHRSGATALAWRDMASRTWTDGPQDNR